MARPVQITVIGASEGEGKILDDAEAVGRLIAEAGAVLVCGGMTGVMEAVSRGASEAGGTVIAIVPTTDPADANPHVTHSIATGIGHARNLAVVASGDAVIAIGGSWGTLSEIAFARTLGRGVVALDSWPLRARSEGGLGIEEVADPKTAVARALASAVPGKSSMARTEAIEATLDATFDR